MNYKMLMACSSMLLYSFACNTGNHKNDNYQESQVDMTSIAYEPPMVTADKNGIASDTGLSAEGYNDIVENSFAAVTRQPLSTFSIDVDEAAYSNLRRMIIDGYLPPRGAVRIEEMINYFDYQYPQPTDEHPFAVHSEVGECPWNPEHRLVHIGLQGKTIATDDLPASNFVFLVDVSGSMDEPDKLPLVQSSLELLTDQLREKDKVAIVVYAGNAGLVLPSTSGRDKHMIREAIADLEAGGSTAGGEGILLAYQVAERNFITGGNNRVILATDGDFNVGISSESGLVQLIEEKRKSGVYLSVLGFGTGNYQDGKMQELADRGNGNHSYVDNINEARKVLVREFGSTLFTIAKDVKIQVEFNPAKVQSYRLIGYENRMLKDEDFNDDRKDAGELGSGHTVTALYEVVPVGVEDKYTGQVDELKYQGKRPIANNASDEMLTIKLRYKKPGETTSRLVAATVADSYTPLETASGNFRFSAAVAEFGLLLRKSAYQQKASYSQVISLATSAKGDDPNGYRAEFISLVRSASALKD